MVSIPKSLRHWSVSAHRFLAMSMFPFSARMKRKGRACGALRVGVVGVFDVLDGDDEEEVGGLVVGLELEVGVGVGVDFDVEDGPLGVVLVL